MEQKRTQTQSQPNPWRAAISSLGRVTALTLLALAFAASELQAATYTWTGGGADKIWSTTANWDSNPTAPTFANTTDVIFYQSGAGRLTNALGNPTTIRSITFNGNAAADVQIALNSGGATAKVLTFDTDAVGGNATITVNSGAAGNFTLGSSAQGSVMLADNLVVDHSGSGTFTIGRNIDQTGGVYSLTKTGTGLLVLSSTTNSYGGSTTISAGTLSITNDANLNTNAASSALVFNGGTLQIIGTAYISLNTGRTTTFNATKTVGFDIANAANNFTVSQTLNQTTGGLIKSGPGTLILSGPNTYSGGTTISAGTLSVSAANHLGDATGQLTINAGTLDVQASFSSTRQIAVSNAAATVSIATNVSYANTVGIIGSGGLTKAGPGTFTLSGVNTHSGGTTLSAGTMNINHTQALGTGTFTISDGTTFDNTSGNSISNANNNAQAWNGDFTFTGTTNLDLGTGAVTLSADRIVKVSSGNLTVGGVISGAFFLIKGQNSLGTLTLTGDNTFTGQLQLNGGTVAAKTIKNAGVTSSLGAGTGTNSVIRLGNTGSAGTLTYIGSGDNTDRQVQIGNGAAGTSAAGATITGSGTGPIAFTNAAFNALNTTATANRTLTLSGTSTSANTISGVIADNAASANISVAKAQSGTWILNGDNTFTGPFTASFGTTAVKSIKNAGVACSLGAGVGANSVISLGAGVNSATLTYTGSGDATDRQVLIGAGSQSTHSGAAVINGSGSGPLAFTNAAFNALNTTSNASRTLTLGGTNTGANTISGIIADNTAIAPTPAAQVSVAKADSGKWILSGANTYSGATIVTSGTLLVNNSSGSGTGSGAVTNGATLGGTGTIGGAVTFNAGSHAVLTNGATLALSSSLIIATSGTIPDVHLALSNNVPVGNYTLATYNTTGSSGTFNSTPVLDSGSFAAGTLQTIVTSGGNVVLQVTSASVSTTTTVATSGSPSTYGQNVTFTATIIPASGVTVPTGTVQFKVDGANLGSPVTVTTGASPNGTAAASTAAIPVTGSPHLVQAFYTASGSFTDSSGTLSGGQTVNYAGTSVALVSSSPTNGYLSGVTFTATVLTNGITASLASGTVQFKTNNVAFGSPLGLASGIVSTNLSTLPRGTNTIVAEYSGDVNYLPSTNTILQIVTNHPPVAVADSLSWGKGTASKDISITNLLANDTDSIDGDTITLLSVDAASANGVVLTTNATYVQYTGALTNNDSFSYTISDGHGGTATALVSITATNTASAASGSIEVVGGQASTVFFGITGDQYEVQRSTNLVDWKSISTNTAPDSGAITNLDTFSDLTPPYPGAAYYRLQPH